MRQGGNYFQGKSFDQVVRHAYGLKAKRQGVLVDFGYTIAVQVDPDQGFELPEAEVALGHVDVGFRWYFRDVVLAQEEINQGVA